MRAAALALAACWPAVAASDAATATFAGGCFWCLEAEFEAAPGVLGVEPGYTGGAEAAPRYAEVTAQATGHYEAVRVTFDAAATSYRRLLVRFWLGVDPTDAEGQFCERGPSRRTAIFVADAAQRAAAEAMRARVEAVLGHKVATEILPDGPFWPAEPEHQGYAARNPLRYDFYRRSCGRDAGLRAVWDAERIRALGAGTPD